MKEISDTLNNTKLLNKTMKQNMNSSNKVKKYIL